MTSRKLLIVNIGFIPDSLGGSEFYTYKLSKALVQQGHEVTVFAALEDLAGSRYQVTHTEIDGIQVIKVTNSWLNARSFREHFIDERIDAIFKEIVLQQQPDLIHFQHVAYLSGNLLEIAHKMNIPSIFTLHDYWYLCFRSRLIRPDAGICAGPNQGAHCATCVDPNGTHPMAVANYPLLIKLMHQPMLNQLIMKLLDKIPQSLITQLRAFLFKNPKRANSVQTPDPSLVNDNVFRFNYFKQQLQYATFLLSPSQHLKRRYEAEGYQDIQMLPLGYDQPEHVMPPPCSGTLKIAFIGNIERHKGVTVLLNELAQCQPGTVEINVYGRFKDPTYAAEAKKVARHYPEDIVTFHGSYRSDRDLPTIFSNNHLVVVPSIWEENAPLVVREAILHGIPVVGSNLGGIPEVIEDGVNGFLFDPFHQGALSSIIKQLITEPQRLEKITQGARNTKIENMSDHTEKITALYARAINKHQDFRRLSPVSGPSDLPGTVRNRPERVSPEHQHGEKI